MPPLKFHSGFFTPTLDKEPFFCAIKTGEHRDPPLRDCFNFIVGADALIRPFENTNLRDDVGIVPYGRALPPITLIIRVEEIAVDCRFEQRRRTGVLRAVKNGEIR